jgi:stage II sporulation protein P
MHRRKRPAPARAALIALSVLFIVSLFGFSILNNRATLLPGSGTSVAPGDQAAAPGYWAMGLLSLELTGSRARRDVLTASALDPDWQVTTKPAAGTAPIVSDGPVIMFYSTHSNESYRKLDSQVYKENGTSRTLNANFNILKVNRTLSSLLKDKYEFPVFFDSTDHELGKYYTTSYERSLRSIETAKKKYSSLRVFIDIHRDSMGSSGIGDTVTVNGKKCARVMIVVGTGKGKTGAGFAQMPDYKSNKALADALTEEINKLAPGLCRPVRVKTGRYNQHVSSAALAIEVGHNMNTLDEALNAVPYLAEAIRNVLERNLDIRPVCVP